MLSQLFKPADFLVLILILLGIGLFCTLLLLAWVIWRVKRLNLPGDSDFFTTLRVTPLSVVLLLDVLDFTLDFFSAPFAWVLLGYLGLKPLRAVTVIESFIPGSQLIPTMTVAWIIARMIRPQYIDQVKSIFEMHRLPVR